MSRVGKRPILIPEGVEVKTEDRKITIKGPKGELSYEVHSEIEVQVEGEKISISPSKKAKKTKALWGLTRTLIANMIEGVTKGYEKKLAIEGLGYRASLEEKDLTILVGFTHPVKIKAPEGINFSVEKNIITVSGINKELVGQISAKIRKIRPPEPYKGKGIRYLGEIIKRKVGKRAITTT